jgi:hypothetical protein
VDLFRDWSDRLFDAAKSAARCSPLLILFAVTFVGVLMLNPAKAGLALWGLSKLGMGGYVGYWIDRFAFGAGARPHLLDGVAQGAAWKRRSLIIGASILAAALIP